jgi:hypothetical protein
MKYFWTYLTILILLKIFEKFFIKFDIYIKLFDIETTNTLEILALICMSSSKNIFRILNFLWNYKRY